jgi:hypothetical protein
MAPILTSATGITPQVLENPHLFELLNGLKALAFVDSEDTLRLLTDLLESHTEEWLYEETVRLSFW